jgi:CubicO group peptidase (beta-lactamase class C family)
MAAALKHLASIFLSTSLLAPNDTTSPVATETIVSYLDKRVPELCAEWKVPGCAIAIIKDNKVIHEKGFGMRDKEQGLPVTSNTLFAIGSTTKAFTAFAAGTLLDEKKLDLDTPVCAYLPSFSLYDAAISNRVTTRDLLCHRTGVPRHDLIWGNSSCPMQELVHRLRYLQNNADLRSKFEYNNLMYVAAGQLIERVAQMSWEDIVRNRIFAPLKMSRSNFSVEDSQKDTDHALPYIIMDGTVKRIPFRQIQNVGPAGSINSCLNDLIPWVQLNLHDGASQGKQLIQSETLQELLSPQMLLPTFNNPEIEGLGYGLGWVIENYRGHRRVWHNGGIDGFVASISLLPEQKIGIIVLANMDDTILPDLITREILDRQLELSPLKWNELFADEKKASTESREEERANKGLFRKTGTYSSHDLQDYVGEYEHPGYGILSIGEKDNQLEMTYNAITSPLMHWHYDVFEANPLPSQDDLHKGLKLLFASDLAGDICSVEVPMEPSVSPIVFSKKPSPSLFLPSYLRQFVGTYKGKTRSFTIALTGNALKLMEGSEYIDEFLPKSINSFVSKHQPSKQMRFICNSQGLVDEALIETESGALKILSIRGVK